MDFELVVVQGRSASSIIKLNDGVTTVGRHDACQLRIKSAQVSRKHCEIFEKKGLLLVKDLNSSNGTIVNGKRIDGQRVLEPGDELTIGPIQLRVSRVGAAAVAAAAPAPAKPGGKAGDTAVTEALAADASESDDFTLSLEEGPETVAAAAAPVATPASRNAAPAPKAAAPVDDEDLADFLIDMPIDEEESEAESLVGEATQVVPVASAAPVAAPAKTAQAPPPEKAKPKEPEASDDAIADFLLDIKLDEE